MVGANLLRSLARVENEISMLLSVLCNDDWLERIIDQTTYPRERKPTVWEAKD